MWMKTCYCMCIKLYEGMLIWILKPLRLAVLLTVAAQNPLYMRLEAILTIAAQSPRDGICHQFET